MLRARFAQQDLHAGMRSAELRQRSRQVVRADRRSGADADRAHGEAHHLGHRAPALFDGGQRRASAREESGPGGGQRCAARTAIEEPRAHLRFETLDRRGQRRLRDVRMPRGRGERAVLRDEREMAERLEHGAPS